jgi:hypothetical protein
VVAISRQWKNPNSSRPTFVAFSGAFGSEFVEQVSRQSCPFMGSKDRRRTEGSRLLPGINRMS